VRWNLDRLEGAIRRYWSLEFPDTPFPDSLFNTFLVLARAMGEGMDAVALAHLLHQYVRHLQSRSKR
jgi:hypothetical protein